MSATDGYTIGGAATSTTDPLTVQNTQADRTADLVPMYSAAAQGTVAINIANLLGVGSQVAAISDSQTLANKILDNTNVYYPKDTSLTLQNASDATKQAQFLLSSITAGQTRIFTLPDYNGTMATQGGTETLTNKTLTAPIINNADISADSYDGYTDADTGTIFGIGVTNGAFSSAISMTSTLAVTGAVTMSSTLSTVGQPTFQNATSPPAAGASTAGIKFSSTANLGLFFGSGAPTFSAAKGSLYVNTSATTTTTRLYINSSGSTTWATFTASA